MAGPYTTQQAALDDYLANLGYETAGGIQAAQTVVIAGKSLMALRPNEASNQGSSLTINNATIQREVYRAQVYINRMQRVGGGAKILGVDETFRGRNYPQSGDPAEVPT